MQAEPKEVSAGKATTLQSNVRDMRGIDLMKVLGISQSPHIQFNLGEVHFNQAESCTKQLLGGANLFNFTRNQSTCLNSLLQMEDVMKKIRRPKMSCGYIVQNSAVNSPFRSMPPVTVGVYFGFHKIKKFIACFFQIIRPDPRPLQPSTLRNKLRINFLLVLEKTAKRLTAKKVEQKTQIASDVVTNCPQQLNCSLLVAFFLYMPMPKRKCPCTNDCQDCANCLSPACDVRWQPALLNPIRYRPNEQPKDCTCNQKPPKSPNAPFLHFLRDFEPHHLQWLLATLFPASVPSHSQHVQPLAAVIAIEHPARPSSLPDARSAGVRRV